MERTDDRNGEPLSNREAREMLAKRMESKKCTMTVTVSGPQGCGKSTFLGLLEEAVAKGWSDKIVAVRFEERQTLSESEPVEVPYIVWKQRDGTLILVKDMDDHHLYCAIRMLERNAEARAKCGNSAQRTVDPDVPFYELTREQCLDRPVYHVMVKVAEARGIDLSEKAERSNTMSAVFAAPYGKKCACWAGRPGNVRMTTKLLEQRAKCPVHGGKKYPVR